MVVKPLFYSETPSVILKPSFYSETPSVVVKPSFYSETTRVVKAYNILVLDTLVSVLHIVEYKISTLLVWLNEIAIIFNLNNM